MALKIMMINVVLLSPFFHLIFFFVALKSYQSKSKVVGPKSAC
jgi:hypothetical protein